MFHLKEWTYTELAILLRDVGFSSWRGYRVTKGVPIRLPMPYFTITERLIGQLQPPRRRRLSRYLMPELMMAAIK